MNGWFIILRGMIRLWTLRLTLLYQPSAATMLGNACLRLPGLRHDHKKGVETCKHTYICWAKGSLEFQFLSGQVIGSIL